MPIMFTKVFCCRCIKTKNGFNVLLQTTILRQNTWNHCLKIKAKYLTLSHLPTHFDASTQTTLENIMAKVDIAYDKFLLLSQCFQIYSLNLHLFIENVHAITYMFSKLSLLICFIWERVKWQSSISTACILV